MSDIPTAPDLIYAKTSDGLDLPVIDCSNPRFAVPDDPESLAALRAEILEWARQRRWVPPFVTRLLFRHAAQRSRLVRAIYQSDRGFLDSITTYILKLGPENLPPGFDGPIDQRAAATPHVALVRLRMQQVARLLADALAPALAAEPTTPLHLINIAGGPALDSINALIMLNSAGTSLRARQIVIHVLDAHEEGPCFGANALAALQRPGAPLHGLAVELRHQTYDWNATQLLADLLAWFTREPAITAASSEGGLFEYGSDEAIVANLEVLASAPVGVKFVAGSVTSDNPLRKDMISVTTFKLHPRGAAGVAALAARAGYELARNLPTLISDQVLLRLRDGVKP
jgi:hypothetical protein